MECEKYQEMISGMLDGELPENEREELMAHIGQCRECRAMYEAFAAVSSAMGESAEPPAHFHESIMNGVKSAAQEKKHKGMLIRLRPYITAAACLVVIVGAVFALRGGRGNSNAPMMYAASRTANDAVSMDMAGGTEESAPAAAEPAAIPATEPEENIEGYTCTDTGVGSNQSSNSGLSAVYRPGDEIIRAWLLNDVDNSSLMLTDVESLTQMLAESLSREALETDREPDIRLDVQTAEGYDTLSIYFDGDSLWCEMSDGYVYLASCTPEELEAIK